MKISKLLFALMLGTILVSCNCHKPENQDKVPYRVTASFANGYPGATDIKWEVEGDLYEAEFNYQFTKYEVKYDGIGRVVEIEYVVDNKYLPEGVLAQAEAKYPNRKFEAEYIEHRRFGYWEVESTEDAEGEEEVEMTFTVDGKLFEADKAVSCIDKCYSSESCEKSSNCKKSTSCHSTKSCDGEEKASCHGDEKACKDKSTSCKGKDEEAHHSGNEDQEEDHVEGNDHDEDELEHH